jgi:UPF0716 protein FxsA
LIAVVALPVTEIALFVLVGGQVGVWGTLGLVLLGGIAGVLILRLSGGQALAELRRAVERGEDPAPALVQGAMRLMAAGMLIIPGFFTDFLALLLLLPPVQKMIFARIRGRILAAAMAAGRGRPQGQPAGDVIETEWEEVPTEKKPTHQPSGWTRH